MPLSTATAQTAKTAAAMHATMNVFIGRVPLISLVPFYNDCESVASEIAGSKVALLRCNALGLGGILGRVDVEERVDGRARPIGDGDAVARGPGLDLVQVLLDQRLAQIGSQRDRP